MRRWMRVFHDVRSGIMFGRRGAIALRCAIFVGILTNLDVYFRPTTLFNTLLMLVLLFGGVGLVARALRPQQR